MLTITIVAYGQTLPIDFESTITTSSFTDFDGGTASVIPNPHSTGINTSATVAQIIRDGGEVWAGSKIILSTTLDFTTDNILSMKVYTTAQVGTVVKFKLENGSGAADERDAVTTVSGQWETLTWDFTGVSPVYNEVVFMFDFGNTGNGTVYSTFLFDDVEQVFGGAQLDVPVTFEGNGINYSMTDFGGNQSSLVADPTNASNNVIKVIKTSAAAGWAGTTIGTNAGFANNLPLSMSDSKMNVRVWSPDAGIPVRLKVENSNDPTQTCETQTNTTMAGAWETIEFDFSMEANGTAALDFGLQNGWIYNMASIFFNFDTDGAAAGEKTYYFDDVKFGPDLTNVNNQLLVEGIEVFPNPTSSNWLITSENTDINRLEIFDLNGRLIVSIHPNTQNVTVDATDFTNGIYIAKISTDIGARSMKLVKQ